MIWTIASSAKAATGSNIPICRASSFQYECPSNYWNDFDSYGAFGKMRIGLGILDGKLEWTR